MGDWDRPLTEREQRAVVAARQKAWILYEGVRTPHRSCGIAMAETFGLPTPAYQSLRRGGITGEGECGVVVSGRLILGEIFGDPDPTGAVTDSLRAAIGDYTARYRERIGRTSGSCVCNALVGHHDDFWGAARVAYCTRLTTEVAGLVAETVVRNGGHVEITPIDGVPGFDPQLPEDPVGSTSHR